MSSGKALRAIEGQTDADAFRRFWTHEGEPRHEEKDLALPSFICISKRQPDLRWLPHWSLSLFQGAEPGDPGQQERSPQRSTVGRRPKPSAEIERARAARWALDATAPRPFAAQSRWFDIFVHNDLGSYVERTRRKELYSYDAMRSYSPLRDEIDVRLIDSMKCLRTTVREAERTKPPAPWQLDSTQIDVVETYEAEVVGEDGEEYVIEFADYDGGTVEARLGKREFQGFPYPAEEGTYFGIVVYRRKGQPGTTASAWPVAEHWHHSLQELPDVE